MKNTPNKADSAPISEVKPARKTQAANTPLHVVANDRDEATIAKQNAEKHALSLLKRNKKKKPLKLIENIETLFLHHPEFEGGFRYNEFTHDVVRRNGKSISNDDTPCIRLALEKILSFTPSRDLVESGVMTAAKKDSFDPLLDALKAMPAWDGVKRLDTWLHVYGGAENTEINGVFGKKTMIAAVARARRPACKVDTMLVLEGPQGTLKSTSVQTLAGAFYADLAINTKDKDGLQDLVGCWIIEVGELVQKGTQAAIKRFLTTASDKYRASYGSKSTEVDRRSIFIGTSNDSKYLNDPTGARRYWPVRVAGFDIEKLKADRDQLWAEAIVALEADEPWHLTEPRHIEMHKQLTDGRRDRDTLVDKLEDWLRNHGGKVILYNRGSVSAVEAIEEGLGGSVINNKRDQWRVTDAFRELGFEKRKTGEGRMARWFKPANWDFVTRGVDSVDDDCE